MGLADHELPQPAGSSQVFTSGGMQNYGAPPPPHGMLGMPQVVSPPPRSCPQGGIGVSPHVGGLGVPGGGAAPGHMPGYDQGYSSVPGTSAVGMVGGFAMDVGQPVDQKQTLLNKV